MNMLRTLRIQASTQPARLSAIRPSSCRSRLVCRAEGEAKPDLDLMSDEDKEKLRKKQEAERLRQAEKFMVVGSGKANCTSCGYDYKPENGDPEYPVAKGTRFDQLPEDWNCPICGAPKSKFKEDVKVVAGFAENQQYGLGTNTMTSDQKSLLIYGTLAFFFFLFLGGYFLE